MKEYLKQMKEKNSGKILNVASIAGFMPGPLMATYYATKNYIVRLSEAIREELKKENSKVQISILCQLYGKLLTEKQYEFLDDYYNNDLSLSEIAENNNITRQAVRDIIKKGEKKLFEYEEKLMFMKRTLNQEKKIEKALSELTKIQKDYSDQQVASVLESIKKELSCLV